VSITRDQKKEQEGVGAGKIQAGSGRKEEEGEKMKGKNSGREKKEGSRSPSGRFECIKKRAECRGMAAGRDESMVDEGKDIDIAPTAQLIPNR